MSLSPSVLDDVHEFWFGKLKGPDAEMGDKQKVWFGQDDAFDAKIRERFGAAISEAAETDWDLSALSREQQVGLVVLLDQFPRNIYRSSEEAFAYDKRALGIADRLMSFGIDRYYRIERMFLFMPAMHSEEIANQDRCVLLFAEEALKAPDEWKETFRGGLDFATKHRDLIRKFGRFPHRNEMLDRKTTPEEAEFLEKTGRGF